MHVIGFLVGDPMSIPESPPAGEIDLGSSSSLSAFSRIISCRTFFLFHFASVLHFRFPPLFHFGS
jgi:hypothetical protein